ncbi:MAG: RDD family protein [Marmoricola sp.]
MSSPAGWHADPYPLAPGTPPQLRYWDGQAWTAHVSPSAQPGQNVQATQAGPPTTPDGVPLAGWWSRVGAALIDAPILMVLVGLVAFPLVRDLIRDFVNFFEDVTIAAENGVEPPSNAQFQRDIAGTMAGIAGIGFAINFAYTVGFLTWRQATPGKLALGLRVRLRERPDLPTSAVLRRWALQSGAPGLLGLVPFIGLVGSLFTFLDVLWPLWDSRRQALHDKFAKTNVVRIR